MDVSPNGKRLRVGISQQRISRISQRAHRGVILVRVHADVEVAAEDGVGVRAGFTLVAAKAERRSASSTTGNCRARTVAPDRQKSDCACVLRRRIGDGSGTGRGRSGGSGSTGTRTTTETPLVNHAPSTPARASKGRKWACARAYSRRQRVTSPQKASGRWACGKTSARWRRSARAAPSCHTSWRHTQSTRVARLSSRSRAAMRSRGEQGSRRRPPGQETRRGGAARSTSTREARRDGDERWPRRDPPPATKPSARDAAAAAHSAREEASSARGRARRARRACSSDATSGTRGDTTCATPQRTFASRGVPEADALASKSSASDHANGTARTVPWSKYFLRFERTRPGRTVHLVNEFEPRHVSTESLCDAKKAARLPTPTITTRSPRLTLATAPLASTKEYRARAPWSMSSA